MYCYSLSVAAHHVCFWNARDENFTESKFTAVTSELKLLNSHKIWHGFYLHSQLQLKRQVGVDLKRLWELWWNFRDFIQPQRLPLVRFLSSSWDWFQMFCFWTVVATTTKTSKIIMISLFFNQPQTNCSYNESNKSVQFVYFLNFY